MEHLSVGIWCALYERFYGILPIILHPNPKVYQQAIAPIVSPSVDDQQYATNTRFLMKK